MCSLQDSFRVTFIAKLCRYIALAKIQPPFSRFYISLTIQANLDIDTFKCLLHVWQSVSWLWHFLLDLIHSREKQLCIHCKFFPLKKCRGIPVLQNVPCKMHVSITRITCTLEITAKIIRKFEKKYWLRVYIKSPHKVFTYFKNYRGVGIHAIPINLKSPHSDFPCNSL